MPKKIIVIEDDSDILELMQYILEDEGYIVLPSKKAEPVESIAQNEPNLILLDDKLTGGFGHELCEAIKLHPQTTNIPVILVSATNNLEEVARDCRADTYLNKPFDLNEFLNMVKAYA